MTVLRLENKANQQRDKLVQAGLLKPDSGLAESHPFFKKIPKP